MNHTLAAADRHIADIESRIARQSALIDEWARSGLNTQRAERDLRALEQVLDRTRERTQILLAPMRSTTVVAPDSPYVQPALVDEPDALAPWESPQMRIAQLAWGEGCSKPGGAGHLLELAKSLDLDSTKTVMMFGVGLGGGARAIHRRFDARIAGYEIDAEAARAARQLSVLARLEKAVDIVRYNPKEFAPRPDSYDCILSAETLFQIERKDDLLGKLALGLKPRGQIVMTDFVLGPGASPDDKRLKALASDSAFFWPANRYAQHFRERNFDLGASEDITAAYRKMVVDGCRRFAEGGPEFIANAKAYPAVTLALMKLCEARVAAFDSGLLKVMRFSAVKLSSPKLMSNW
ncbi:MAG: methyltransferase domain-containing protein [Dongiaceae bacterium]